MSIWGTLGGIGVGIVTGNPALGTATAGAINAASGSGSATNCPGQKTSELSWLMGIISQADRTAWLNAAGIGPSGKSYWADAIRSNNAASLAFHLAGGSDCKVTSEEGKAFVAYTLSLLQRYEDQTGLPQTPTLVPPPGTSPLQQAATAGAQSAATTFAQASAQQRGFDPLLIAAAAAVALILILK